MRERERERERERGAFDNQMRIVRSLSIQSMENFEGKRTWVVSTDIELLSIFHGVDIGTLRRGPSEIHFISTEFEVGILRTSHNKFQTT